MKLIWHAENLSEVDWLRFILGDLIDEEIVDLDLTYLGDHSIHVVSSNLAPLRAYEPYFRRCREAGKNIVLLHLSDEWFSGGYETYKYFDLVLRNYSTPLARDPGIITLPLGYTNGMGDTPPIRPADQRAIAWSFAGEVKASRLDMVKALSSLEPHAVTDTSPKPDRPATRLSKPDFKAQMGETVFAPCPMGNVVIDTWRMYESLESGCIPLVEARRTLDYFQELFGPHPIPTFRSWADARRYCRRLIDDKPRLLQTQAEIAAWWAAVKDNTRAQLRQALTGPSHSADLQAFSRRAHNRYQLLHEPLRLIGLLRHQSTRSLVRRLSRPMGPVKRILRETFRPRAA